MKKLNKEVGNYSEELATNYLKAQGYLVLERNFRNFLGEIDIICQKKDLLVIVEVKGRYSYNYGIPKESVTIYKQKSILKVATSYITYKKLNNMNLRFDVIEIFLNQKNNLFKIDHIEDAFRA